MKFKWTCLQCQEKFNEKNLSVAQINSLILQGKYSIDVFSKLEEFNDKNYYELECKKGHKTNLVIQNEMYEIHFDFGILFYKKGIYRAAFLEFVAAFESFIQYGNIYMLGDGTYEDYKSLMSTVGKLSERHLGGFLYLYYNHFRKVVEIKTNMATMRNNVIHNGHFPTKEETKNYAEYVLEIIRTALIDFQTYDSPVKKQIGITGMLFDRKFYEVMNKTKSKEESIISNSVLIANTILSNCIEKELASIEECMAFLDEQYIIWEI